MMFIINSTQGSGLVEKKKRILFLGRPSHFAKVSYRTIGFVSLKCGFRHPSEKTPMVHPKLSSMEKVANLKVSNLREKPGTPFE